MALNKTAARLILAVGLPLLLLAAVEGVMRGFSLGYPTSFLVAGGARVLVNNPFYGYRFFPHELARNPPPIVCDRDKPAGVIRVVVLGESAALGDPVIPFSAPRMLEKMLNDAGGTPRFEVINAAMTAINAAVIADIASELKRLEPDIVILYIGNNEAVGPYGPGTVVTLRGWAGLTPLRVRLSRLRLVQLFHAGRGARGRARAPESFGMQLFAANRLRADDARLKPMYRLYENRMERIVALSRAAGAEVLLCTVAVNLAGCAPFGSDRAAILDSRSWQAWKTAYARGVAKQARGLQDEALKDFEEAAALDDSHAELAYRRAVALSAAGRAAEAQPLFARARDLDIQRFRADSAINGIIREVAACRGVRLLDIERSLAVAEEADRLFLDHVHFTFDGAYRLAGEWFDALAQTYPHLAKPTMETCRDRMFFTAWGEAHQAMVMQRRRAQMPFAAQFDNETHQRRLAEVVRRCNEEIEKTDIERLRALYEDNARRDPGDVFYPMQWATILMAVGRTDEAMAVIERESSRMAHHFEWRIIPAYLLAKKGEPERGAKILIGGGPPYGWYLADHTDGVMKSLEADGLRAEAGRVGEAVLNGVARFPGRAWLAERVAELR